MGVIGNEDADLHLRDCQPFCLLIMVLCSALRMEWCKSCTRSMRFTKEVHLLQEEVER